jgi:DNA-binding CsgD family transcriptional regulator
MLRGRTDEQSVIDRLLADARSGQSGVLIVRGEPGIGKTALLDYALSAAGGMRLIRGVGVESEAELPFAGLHLLLRSALERIGMLPDPQRRALEGAFGLGPGVPADRLLVGLAVLSLLSELAEDSPLLCVVDDAQWLDHASADALVFAARRLDAEGIALIFAAREGEDAFPAPGLPELHLAGLAAEAAAVVLDDRGREMQPVVRYRVLAEAQGNPLALLELPAAFAAESPAGPADSHREAAAGPGPVPLTSRLQQAFEGQVNRLPAATQSLLLVAAADDTGDLAPVLRAAATFSAGLADLPPAEHAALIRLTEQRVAFRHPLVRAAAYQRAPLSMRLTAHRALADALDRPDDADRRAWHLAAATTGPDEHVAADLEHTAVRARTRNGYAAAASAYERAARLGEDSEARTRRLTLAAEAAIEAGELDRAHALAEQAVRHNPDAELHTRLAQVQASAEFGQGSLRRAHARLIDGTGRVCGSDPQRAVEMLLKAVNIAWFIGDRELAAATAARLDDVHLPSTDPLVPVAQLLKWLIALILDRSPGLPPVPEMIAEARRLQAADSRSLLLVCSVALLAGREAETHEVAAQLVAECRAKGAIGLLPSALYYVAAGQTFLGRHSEALTSATEALHIAQDTEQRQWASHAASFLAYLAAIAGDEQRCRSLADDAIAAADALSPAAGRATWALSVLDLGYGRAEKALSRLEGFARGQVGFNAKRGAPDLIEAAVRLGRPDRAGPALARLEAWAARVHTPAIDALVERCRALLAPDEHAHAHYIAALTLHSQDSRPFAHARTELLYGEWLRRARRKTDARDHLHAALETFERLGAAPWADRARAELHAAGTPRASTTVTANPGPLTQLTPQELQITRLAAHGLSNRDIAAQLFLSPRTIGYHLYKAYPKLGIATRAELAPIVLDPATTT